MLDSKDFNLWADGYDKSVNVSEENNEYPFAGYKDLLNYIYSRIMEKKEAGVLDIGFGTGILTTQLYQAGCKITGMDFSDSMMDIAKKKMPDAKLMNWDFSKGVPEDIKACRFDFIVSTYAIHHVTDEEKLKFIESLSSMLNPNGQIFIGDVSFATRSELEKSMKKNSQIWDKDEIYFVAEEMTAVLRDKYICDFIKISHCSGILILENR